MIQDLNRSPNRSLSLEEVTAPASEPVTVLELKSALSIDASVTDHDALLAIYISAARRNLEATYKVRMINQVWRLWLDSWPQRSQYNPLNPYQIRSPLSEIEQVQKWVDLILHQISAIAHVKTYDNDGMATTFDAVNYYLDASHKPSRLALKRDSQWPITDLRDTRAIEIQFTAGFGAAASNVPAEMRAAVLGYAMAMFDARGCSSEIPEGVAAAMGPWVNYKI